MSALETGRILITGGAGYIGSHTVVVLVNAGHTVTIVDNLVNSNPLVLERLKALVTFPERIKFVEGDLRDKTVVDAVLAAEKYDAVIHFAALKAVGESTSKPLEYYENNMTGLFNVLSSMKTHGVKQIVFSSSATVYGSGSPPFTEESTTGVGILSPYGQTKFMAERVLQDCAAADRSLGVALLRYFNPVGAHPSGTIGEDPRGIPNNLVPVIQRVAVGKMAQLSVFGTDYATPDGTAQRDYIHVVDLAAGHLAALQWLSRKAAGAAASDAASGGGSSSLLGVFNLGSGAKHTVLEVVAAFERASGRKIPYQLCPRRVGDAPAVWADCSRAAAELGWAVKLGLDAMCEDSWRWASRNPDGYDTVHAPAAAKLS